MKICLSKKQWEYIGKIAGWPGWKSGSKKITPSDLASYIKDGTFYGLITPTGDFYECGFMGHFELIAFLENMPLQEAMVLTFKDIERLGYVRIAINNKFSNYVEFEGSHSTIDKYRDLITRIQEQYNDWLLDKSVSDKNVKVSI